MKALEVPENLRVIGGFLDYPRLAAATTVCRTWNTVLTPFLYYTLERDKLIPQYPSSVVKDHVDHIHVIRLSSVPWIPTLEGCTHLTELHLSLDFGSRVNRDVVWMPLVNLVYQNPRLITVCATDPSNGFLKAVFTCCPQLQRLEVTGPNLKTFVMDDLFLDVCLHLEELKLLDTEFDIVGHHSASWTRWPMFPTITKLWIGHTRNKRELSDQVQQEHAFIQHCPNLESLKWSFSMRHPPPAREIKDLLSPKTSSCPKIKAFALHTPGFRPRLSADVVVEILYGCNHHLAYFESEGVQFTRQCSQVLISSFASTLTRLRVKNSGLPHCTSMAMMDILSSCPHLVHVHCAGPLDARDILGIGHDMNGYQEARVAQLFPEANKATKSPSKSIHPPEWACKNLQTLEIGICGLQNKAQEWQQVILKQLAKLEQLRVLNVHSYYAHEKVSQDGLDFRLATGLGILSSLTMLERLGFGCLRQKMSKQDIEWMVKAWPRFSEVHGWVHHSPTERVELKRLFKTHGIAVRDSERDLKFDCRD